MLTIFGSTGGAGIMWCVFNAEGIDPVNLGIQYLRSFGPCAFRLPPNDGLLYDTSLTQYGMADQKIHQGALSSVRGKKETPNPCIHLNNVGTVLNFQGGTPTMSNGSWNTFGACEAYLTPLGTGAEVVHYMGYPTPAGKYFKAYDRYGNIIRASNMLYYDNFYMRWVSPIDPVLGQLGGRIPFTDGMRVYLTRPPYAITDRWAEYESNVEYGANSIKQTVNSDSRLAPRSEGIGAFFTYVHDLTITHIQGHTNGLFTIYLTHTITKHWLQINVNGTVDVDETTSETFNSESALQIFYPNGILGNSSYSFPELERNLFDYLKISTGAYSEKMAGIARNNAIADISALESNNLENIAGLKGSFSVLGDLIKGYAAILSGDIAGAAKAASGAYLWYSYAVAPTISDVKDITKNTSRLVAEVKRGAFSKERRRGKTNSDDYLNTVGTSEYYCTLHTRLRDSVYAEVWSALEKFGLEIGPSQMWDLIPYSFVVDWFTSIGPVLTRIDAYNNMCLTRDVEHRIETYKTTKIGDPGVRLPSGYQLMGTYKRTYYNRQIFSGPGKFDPLTGQDAHGMRSSQMAQGAALIVQKLD